MPNQVIIALDPGTRNTGWAKFVDGLLESSGTIETPASRSAFEQIYQIRERIRKKMLEEPRTTELWIESYDAFGPRKKANAQNILQGALYGLYDSLKYRKEDHVRVVPPSVWKPWAGENHPGLTAHTPHERDAIGS